jgi:hypothetical protein
MSNLENESDVEIEKESAFLEKVRRRAYALWLQDGEQPDKDREYWFQAEQEVAEEEGRTPPSEASIPPRGLA